MTSYSGLLGLTPDQWEDLCDGCGRCCMVKLLDEDSGDVHYTNVVCEFLDTRSCRCSDYQHRAEINPDCVVLTPDNLDVLPSMPFTCRYRLVHEGREMIYDTDALKISGRVISEKYIHEDQLPQHIVEWVSTDRE